MKFKQYLCICGSHCVSAWIADSECEFTFVTRDEGYELIKIIESRVVEVGDGVPKGLEKTMCNAVASHQNWKSLNQSRKLPETISCSSGSLNAISSRSAFQVLTPELTKSAVRESKKWFEDKKLSSSSKLDFDCRPCTLNTKMCQYVSVYFFPLFSHLSTWHLHRV